MFKNSIKLFKLMGFEVKIDISWFIIAILIVWTLTSGLFPAYFSDLTFQEYLFMGIVGALGLFTSIILHEFSHSIVARRYGIPIKGITLFIFGGVAEIDKEPENPKSEFLIAAAGPIVSIVIGFILWIVYLLSQQFNWAIVVQGVLFYLFTINIMLAIFNLFPAFPLDGGRILRSILWYWKKNIILATKIATRLGSIFGMILIFLGIFTLISGNFVSGMWWFLIGLFIRTSSKQAYQQLIIHKELEGIPVSQFMNSDPITVPNSINVNNFVNNYVYKYRHNIYPITTNSGSDVCISINDVKEIPKKEWDSTMINDLAKKCSTRNTISPDTSATKALKIMQENNNNRLLVVENGKLLGIISLKDLLTYLSIKRDLES
jgi:Zn-dependent protease